MHTTQHATHTSISTHLLTYTSHTQASTDVGSCVWGASSPFHRNPCLPSFDKTEIQQGRQRREGSTPNTPTQICILNPQQGRLAFPPVATGSMFAADVSRDMEFWPGDPAWRFGSVPTVQDALGTTVRVRVWKEGCARPTMSQSQESPYVKGTVKCAGHLQEPTQRTSGKGEEERPSQLMTSTLCWALCPDPHSTVIPFYR